ncbi:MAG: hypothetical protein E7295_11505 [Lachnospiraceae bacterium]|jgi:hypothetical protein|nr:hypothetical protein [Lachnospiraceae bacterium]
MKFFEYGKENGKSLMIECGYLAKWHPGLLPFVEEASKQFHVIVQAYDGFNRDEPDGVFCSVVEEARMAVDFIVKVLGGKLDVLYGISLGGMVGNEILMDDRVRVHTFIADGYTIMPMPTFRFKCFEKLYVKGYSALIYSVLTKHQGFLAKALGRTRESIRESLYTQVSHKSIENSVISEIGYRYKFESFNKTASYVFHGSAERGAARKVHKLLRKGIRFTHKMFKNTGHAELVHKNPQRLVSLIERAYNGELH